MVATYRARRRIKLGPTSWREPGELVPEAHTWFRAGSWLHTGWIEAVDVDEDELRAAIDQYASGELADQIRANAGVDVPVRHTKQQALGTEYLPARRQPYAEGESPVVEAKTDVEAQRDMRGKAKPRRSNSDGKAAAK